MKDHLNGIYTSDFTANLDGNITVQMLYYQKGGLYYEFWDSSTWTGTISSSGTQATVNNGWTAGQALSGGRLDYLTARFIGALRAPLTGTVTIYVD